MVDIWFDSKWTVKVCNLQDPTRLVWVITISGTIQ